MASRKAGKTSAKTPRSANRLRDRVSAARAAGGGNSGNVVIDAAAQPPRDFHSLSRKDRDARREELRALIGDRVAQARDGKAPDKISRLRELAQLRSFPYDAEFHALLADLETEHAIERTADDVAAAIAPEVELLQLDGIPADHDPKQK